MKNLKLILSLLLLTQTIFAQEERIDAVLKDSIGTLPPANVIVEEIKDSDSILTDEKFALTGSFFDKRANQFVPYDGYIVLKKMGIVKLSMSRMETLNCCLITHSKILFRWKYHFNALAIKAR